MPIRTTDNIYLCGVKSNLPPLTSTCSVVRQFYKTNITGKDKKRKVTGSFITALVPFAERWIYIYEKLIGLDGLPIFRVYQINNSQKQPAYAEQNIVDRLVERVDRLEKQIGGMNHEPDADNGNVTEQR